MNTLLIVLLSMYSIIITINAKRDIYDPYNIFCGSLNCYEILGIVNVFLLLLLLSFVTFWWMLMSIDVIVIVIVLVY